MNTYQSRIRCAVMLLLAFCLLTPVMASGVETSSHFQHMDRDGRAFFDMDTNKMNPENLPLILGGILMTYQEVEAMGITPDFVVGFRGMNTSILTYAQTSPELQALVTTMVEHGIILQVCAKAMYFSGTNPDEIVAGFEVDSNSWITSMLLQNKRQGYAYITF